MLQIIVTIILVVLIFGGFLAITLSRSEGRQLKKSCGCSLSGFDNADDVGCNGNCKL